jgi:hypothetical protein
MTQVAGAQSPRPLARPRTRPSGRPLRGGLAPLGSAIYRFFVPDPVPAPPANLLTHVQQRVGELQPALDQALRLHGATSSATTSIWRSVAENYAAEVRTMPPAQRAHAALALAAVSLDAHAAVTGHHRRYVDDLLSMASSLRVLTTEARAFADRPTHSPHPDRTSNAMDEHLGPDIRKDAFWSAPARRSGALPLILQLELVAEHCERQRDGTATKVAMDVLLAVLGAQHQLTLAHNALGPTSDQLLAIATTGRAESGWLERALYPDDGIDLPYSAAVADRTRDAITTLLEVAFPPEHVRSARSALATANCLRSDAPPHIVLMVLSDTFQSLLDGDADGARAVLRRSADEHSDLFIESVVQRLLQDEPAPGTTASSAAPRPQAHTQAEAQPAARRARPTSEREANAFLRRNFGQVWLDRENEQLLQVSRPIAQGNHDRVRIARRPLRPRLEQSPTGMRYFPFDKVAGGRERKMATLVDELRTMEPLLPEARSPVGSPAAIEGVPDYTWAGLSLARCDAVTRALESLGVVEPGAAERTLADEALVTRAARLHRRRLNRRALSMQEPGQADEVALEKSTLEDRRRALNEQFDGRILRWTSPDGDAALMRLVVDPDDQLTACTARTNELGPDTEWNDARQPMWAAEVHRALAFGIAEDVGRWEPPEPSARAEQAVDRIDAQGTGIHPRSARTCL